MSSHICVILQARVTSTRLNSKVLMEICGKPIIYLIIERLKHCKNIDDVIMAIPDTNQNDVLEEYAKKIGCHYARGCEKDVLSRYFKAAKQFAVTDIIRVTADCPLIDPILVDLMVEQYLKEKVDYAAIDVDTNFPRGLDAEIFSFKTLEKVNMDAHQTYEREHVTPHIYEHPELFKICFVEAQGKFRRPGLRFTVDTEEDLQLMREIFKRFYKNGNVFSLEKVIDLLDEHPELLTINAHIHQKELGQ